MLKQSAIITATFIVATCLHSVALAAIVSGLFIGMFIVKTC